MLQEILMALIGNTGGTIIESEESFEINACLENITTSEKIVIKKICNLGYWYKKIEEFNEDTSASLIDNVLQESVEKIGMQKMEIEEEEKNEKNFNFHGKISEVFEKELGNYFERIMDIEQKFLNGKIINLNFFFIEFSRYFEIFPECLNIIKKVQESLSQSEVLDLFYEKTINGNKIHRELYVELFNSVYENYQKKIKNWLIYGKTSKNFFIKKMAKCSNSSKEKIKDWDNDFLLQISSIPKNIISVKNGQKILFIGKAMRILIKEEGIFSECLKFVSDDMENLNEYKPIYFNKVIENLRKKVSAYFIKFIITKEKIHKDIETTKNIYLLYNEEFFSTFIEECKEIISLPPNKYAEYEINNKSFQNTLLRLNLNAEEEPWKSIKFILKSKGFEYNNFASLKNLQFIGDFEKSETFIKFLSFKNNLTNEELNLIPKPSLWNGIKHNIENNFKIDFCFRFKKSEKFSKIHYVQKKRDIEQNNSEKMSLITIIFQSKYDVNLYKKNKNLFSFVNMNSFLCFNFGFYNQNDLVENEPFSFISVFARYGNNSPQKIFEKKYSLEEMNFSDQDIRFVRINYENNFVRVYIQKNKIDTNINDYLVEFPLVVQDVVDLDLGRAFLGVMNNSSSERYDIDLFSLFLDCKYFLLSSQTWNGLVPFYDCQWPNNIILNTSLLERFEQIFSLIFPIKISKFKLAAIFSEFKLINNKIVQKYYFLSFQKLRCFLNHFFNSILDYIYTDVIKKEVDFLMEDFQKIDDFKILRKKINLFCENIYNQIFFNFPDLIKQIFILVDIVNTYESYLNRIFNYSDKENLNFIRKLLRNSKKIVVEFLKFLRNLSDSGVNQNYNKLILRLNFNSYFDSELLDLDLD